MSHIWTFSPSSQDLVHKCITAARPPDQNNKWVARFGCRSLDQKFNNNTPVKPSKNPMLIVIDSPEQSPAETVEENVKRSDFNTEKFQEFLDVIEQEPLLKFDDIIEECTKNVYLLVNLASKLSITSIEKICKHIFDSKNIDLNFINNFHQYFIPCLLKREYNHFSLDVLVRSHKKYPEAFKVLLLSIIKDVSIVNNILQDFIVTLPEAEVTNLMSVIAELELTSEEFTHNLLSIFTAYKDCKKITQIQNFIFANILRCAEMCSSDKQFGRLLLAFLQAQKELKYALDLAKMERVIETHKSPFRRPCLNVLNELIENVEMNATVDTTRD